MIAETDWNFLASFKSRDCLASYNYRYKKLIYPCNDSIKVFICLYLSLIRSAANSFDDKSNHSFTEYVVK